MKYLLLFLIGLLWGSQYVFNAIALHDFSAFGLTVWRMFIGFITLTLLIYIIPGERVQSLTLSRKLVSLFILIGAVEAVIPFWLIGFGQMRISSSVTSIIMGMIPMITVFLELTFKKGHKTSVYEILGMTLAFAGLIILVDPSADDFSGAAIGYISILMAAFCFAVALVLMEKIPREISSIQATRFILGIYAVPMLIVWFATNNEIPTETNSILSVLFIGIFSSGIVYVLYLNLIRFAGPTFTSLSNYIVPLVGTFMGVWLLSEPFTVNIALALLFIIIGLFIANIKKRQ